MKILERITGILHKSASDNKKQALRETYISKYNAFRDVLAHNTKFLEMVTDMEEKLSSGQAEASLLSSYAGELEAEVRAMAERLDEISGGKYSGLCRKLDELHKELEGYLKGGIVKLKYDSKKAKATAGNVMRTFGGMQNTALPLYKQYRSLIEKGTVASKGIGAGKAFILRSENDLARFPEGAVLVTRYSSAAYSTAIKKASAVITDIGAVTVHIATIAREFGVPMIVNAQTATKVIADGTEITVDAVNGVVYEGKVGELERIIIEQRTGKTDTEAPGELNEIRQMIVQLNLIDPGGKEFLTENCRTFHDVARFAHQKVMQEIFGISEEYPEGIEAVKLTGLAPLAIYLIDLGGGLRSGIASGKPARPDILSFPFAAFIDGLASAEWPEPRHIDTHGFMGMMAHTASMSEAEMSHMGERSFAFISSDYMNFSINLGYHLSVIEALAGDNIIDNYIRIFLKGGGADLQRRIRRGELIAEILNKLDFTVRIKEDIVNAIITKDSRESLKAKLDIIGKLTAYTKQLDAVMHDDSSVSEHVEDFIRKHPDFSGVVL